MCLNDAQKLTWGAVFFYFFLSEVVSQSGARGTGEGSHRAEEVTDIPEEKENLIYLFFSPHYQLLL